MLILTNHRPRSHITTILTNDSALWFSITAWFHNNVVISHNSGVIQSSNDTTSAHILFSPKFLLVNKIFDQEVASLDDWITTLLWEITTLLRNHAVIENHDAESLVTIVVMWLRGLWLVRISIVVKLTTALWLKYNLKGGQCYCVVMSITFLTALEYFL